ncbi:hypothetical protein TIFTF001_009621 [Ficus carica]|uniref:Uncharacterized protein n=1 Tax=Ficus carica TaxID=3494 RepID=A0AA88CZ43_FICCA|nr:hypothetical protein TIFTF001_009621 [Ficus carica]
MEVATAAAEKRRERWWWWWVGGGGEERRGARGSGQVAEEATREELFKLWLAAVEGLTEVVMVVGRWWRWGEEGGEGWWVEDGLVGGRGGGRVAQEATGEELLKLWLAAMDHIDLEVQSENIDLDNAVYVDIELDEDVIRLEGSDLNKPLKKKRLKSKVWDFFDVLPLGPDKKLKSACKKYRQQYLASSNTGHVIC